jgi:hypothetical protein
MKKLIYLLIIISLTSCLATKKISNKSHIEKENTEVNKDSTSIKETNKAIDDKAEIKVKESDTGDRDFDLAVNKAVTDILSSINFQKTSGDNSYKMWYDMKNHMMRLEAKIGETTNSDTSTNSDSKSEKTFEDSLNEYVKKVVVPWWLYVIGFVLIWPYIKPIAMMFLGPTNILSSINTALKK